MVFLTLAVDYVQSELNKNGPYKHNEEKKSFKLKGQTTFLCYT